jgi:hypothetical protein
LCGKTYHPAGSTTLLEEGTGLPVLSKAKTFAFTGSANCTG